MKKKILIIEDEKEHFDDIKAWLVRYEYDVIPSDFSSLSKAKDPNRGTGLKAFALKQIDKHYKEIGLILCDIKLGNDYQGGNAIVRAIRNYRQLSPQYWTTMVPIFGMTNYSEKLNNQRDNNVEDDERRRTKEDMIVYAGADYVFKKQVLFKENKDEHDIDEEDKLRTIIDMQVLKFEKNLNSFYPHDIENEIEGFKNKNRCSRKKNVFIMTSFQEQHLSYANRILAVLQAVGLKGHIANAVGGENSDVLWKDVQVFIHGCDFGIGIYADDTILFGKSDEEIDKETLAKRIRINPNLSQEVGYMLGIHKKVCILKHENLSKINSDLAEKIYVPFNDKNLELKLQNWLIEQHIIDENKRIYH